MIATLIGIAMIIVIPAYLIYFSWFIGVIKKQEPKYWSSIGSPSSFEPEGQWITLKKFVFGISKSEDIERQYKPQLRKLRFLFFFAKFLFLASVFFMLMEVNGFQFA